MLAEISAYDPPVMITAVMACLGFLIWLVNGAMDFWRNIKDKPTGGEVMDTARKEFQPKGHYASQADFSKHVSEVFSKLGGVERGAKADLTDKIKEISSELTSQGKCVASLNTQTEIQGQTLAAVQSDIKIILGRIPRSHHER